MHIRFLRCLVLCFSALCFVAGCGPEKADKPKDKTPPKPKVDPHQKWVSDLVEEDIDSLLRSYADSGESTKRVKRLLAYEVKKGWRQRVRGGIKYADLFEELYSKRQYRKVVSSFDGINAKGRKIFAILEKSPQHALKTKYYSISRIKELDKILAQKAAKNGKWKTIELTDAEKRLLITWLKKHKIDLKSENAREVLLHALAGLPMPAPKPPEVKPAPETPKAEGDTPKDGAVKDAKKTSDKPSDKTKGETKDIKKTAAQTDKKDQPPPPPSQPAKPMPSPVPRITAQVKLFRKAMTETAKDGAELELRLIDATLRYARDMKHFNLKGISWRQMKKAGGSKKIIYKRLEGVFNEVVKTSPAKVANVMHALEPLHPQYNRLLKLRRHYIALGQNGGWPRVGFVALRKGKRGPAVAKLRKRLWLEGYIGKPIAMRSEEDIDKILKTPAPTSDVVDETLINAVQTYRRTHQLTTKGAPGRIFWKSINVPVERRLDEININIERLRSSMYKGEESYILINLPEFHGEHIVKGKMQHRWKVVIGKNNRTCDRKTARWIFPNATPQLASKMEYFVLNPAWFVPDRIVREEIIPFMEEEGWMERKGYKVVKKKGDTFEIRQDPGPTNALGRVKFIFPNPHNTYMHDTPKKQYFKMNIRAQSHGCMRVHEPLKLAKHIVKTQSLGEKYDVDAIIKSKEPKSVRLKEPIPVFVEYMTVRTDEQGYQEFFIDIYYLDRLQTAGKKDFGPCTPPPEPEDKKPSDDIGP